MSGNANIYPYFTFPKRQIGGTQIFSYMTHKSISPWLFVLSGIITTLHFLPTRADFSNPTTRQTKKHILFGVHTMLVL